MPLLHSRSPGATSRKARGGGGGKAVPLYHCYCAAPRPPWACNRGLLPLEQCGASTRDTVTMQPQAEPHFCSGQKVTHKKNSKFSNSSVPLRCMPYSHTVITSTRRKWAETHLSVGKRSETIQERSPLNQAGHRTEIIPGFLSQPYQCIQNERWTRFLTLKDETGGYWWTFCTERIISKIIWHTKKLSACPCCWFGRQHQGDRVPLQQPGSSPAAREGSGEVPNLIGEHTLKPTHCRARKPWSELSDTDNNTFSFFPFR